MIKQNIQEKSKIFIDGLKKISSETINQYYKTQQRFKSEKHNVFTEEINKNALSSNDDRKMQSTNSIKSYAYKTRKDLVSEKEEIKYNNIIKRCKD